jgi:hypothetical protein
MYAYLHKSVCMLLFDIRYEVYIHQQPEAGPKLGTVERNK